MNKKEAAEFLGISERTLERRTAAGEIGCTYKPGTTKPTPIYNDDELTRYKAKSEAGVVRPAFETMTPNSDNPSGGGLSPAGAISVHPEQIMQLIEATARQTAIEVARTVAEIPAFAPKPDNNRQSDVRLTEVPVEARTFLSIEEAAALLGVSVGAIERSIKDGGLKVHRGLARGRRIKRADAQEWASKL
jgi:excisionase family DNA binding protein